MKEERGMREARIPRTTDESFSHSHTHLPAARQGEHARRCQHE